MKEYIEKILKSEALSDEAKKKITALSSGDISPDTIAQIQDIIQSEIDSAFDEAGIFIEESEIKAKMDDLENDLADIEKTISDDADLVKKELESLENIVDQIDESLDQDKIEDLKKEITT